MYYQINASSHHGSSLVLTLVQSIIHMEIIWVYIKPFKVKEKNYKQFTYSSTLTTSPLFVIHLASSFVQFYSCLVMYRNKIDIQNKQLDYMIKYIYGSFFWL